MGFHKKNPAYGRQSISRPMRIIAPMPQEGGPRIPKNPIIHREAWFPPCFERQNQQKKTFFSARRFQTTFKQKCSNLRPLLSITFPQGFRISKNIRHPTSGSGGKKTVKRYLKSEQTHRQTDRRTDGRTDRLTFRIIESIGPEGRCFENLVFGYSWSTWKPRFPMDQRHLVEGRIANFGIFLDVFEFLHF